MSELSELLQDWFPEDEVAAALRKTRRTLQSWRAQGIGPAWTRNGKEILYHRDAVSEYLKANEHQPVRQRRAAVSRHQQAAP
jgi:hypothetical protein